MANCRRKKNKRPPLTTKNNRTIPQIDKEKSEKIIEILKTGAWLRGFACKSVGIGYDTFLMWLDNYKDFADSVKKAEQEGREIEVSRCVSHIRQDKSWQSKAWILERLVPEVFSQRLNFDAMVKLEVKKMTDEELKALLRGSDK